MTTTVEKVANSVHWRFVERISAVLAVVCSTLASALVAILIYYATEKVEKLDKLDAAVSEMSATVEGIVIRQNNFDIALTDVRSGVADIGADIDQNRRSRQSDWNDFRERLTRVETQTATLLQATRDIATKLDSISDRLPRREGLLYPGGMIGGRP